MSKRNRFKLSLSVFLLLIKDGKVLLIKRSNTGWMDGFYSVPAGALDEGESVLSAIVREAKEEVGVTVSKKDLYLVHTIHCLNHGEEWVGLFFLSDKWRGEPKINEPHKHSELLWTSIKKLPKNLIPYVRQAIIKTAKQNQYSEFGWS
ncbi:MAG: NUDIX domain-containing protein [Patescibacteria group bacterium]